MKDPEIVGVVGNSRKASPVHDGSCGSDREGDSSFGSTLEISWDKPVRGI